MLDLLRLLWVLFPNEWSSTDRASVGNSPLVVTHDRAHRPPSTRGMTSPARFTAILSPMRSPPRYSGFRRTWCSLWSVALVTVTPPTITGAMIATGVMAPVRPTWKPTSSRRVWTMGAGYLYAMAQRGLRVTNPAAPAEFGVVDLHHRAVDLVREIITCSTDRLDGFNHLVHAVTYARRAGDLETHLDQAVHQLMMPSGINPFARGVSKELERSTWATSGSAGEPSPLPHSWDS